MAKHTLYVKQESQPNWMNEEVKDAIHTRDIRKKVEITWTAKFGAIK